MKITSLGETEELDLNKSLHPTAVKKQQLSNLIRDSFLREYKNRDIFTLIHQLSYAMQNCSLSLFISQTLQNLNSEQKMCSRKCYYGELK